MGNLLLGGVGVIDLAGDIERGSPPVTKGQILMAQTRPATLQRGRNFLVYLRTFYPSRSDLMAALLNYSPSRCPAQFVS
jgi:hypothetical protein